MNKVIAQNQCIKLIDGSFAPYDASEIVSEIITRKINFHTIKTIGSDEKFGVPDKESIKRISELKGELRKLESFIKEAETSGRQLKINAAIDISLI